MAKDSQLNKKDSKVDDRKEIVKVLNQLEFGEPFDFQFSASMKERLKAKLIGVDDTNFLIFSIPKHAQKGYDDIITQDNPCILRSIIEGESGTCIAFKSHITGVIKKPYPVFFVEYPSSIERFSLRNEVRLTTHAPASIMTHQSEREPQNITYHGTIIDLSSTGCRFKLAWPLSNGTFSLKEIFVKIIFPSKPDSPLIVKGDIKSVSRYDDTQLSLGVKLMETPELKDLFTRLGID